MSGAAAGREHAAAWSESSGFTRRVGLYLRHAELGADRVRLAGEPEEAAAWAAAHHDPSTWDSLEIPPEVEAKARSVPGIVSVSVELVWEPPWTPERMSEAARLELGMV